MMFGRGGSHSPQSLFLEEHVGPDPPFVFLHGLGGTHRYWTSGPLPFPPRSIYLDLLGYGDSPRPLFRYTVDRHLAALHETLVGQAPFILVGHSLGAALAMFYAVRYPAQVRALILIGLPHYEGRRIAYRWLRRKPSGWFMTNMLVTAAACLVTRRLLGRLLPHLLRDYPKEIAEDLVKHNLMSSTTSLWEVLYRHDLAAEADALPERIPVLCLHGIKDSTAPLDGVLRLASPRPNWRVRVLHGADHHPWLSARDECVAALDETAALVGSFQCAPGWPRSGHIDPPTLGPSALLRQRVVSEPKAEKPLREKGSSPWVAT